MKTATQNRDKADGRYTFEGGFERLCRCGHELGEHTAVRHAGEQPCLVSEPDAAEPCHCQSFRPARRPL
jgi:hypothetical protein